jgi:hypothetical protein
MKTKARPWASRVIRWLCETWAEMDYAQRRLVALQMDARSLRLPPERSEAEALEALYALPAREPAHGPE